MADNMVFNVMTSDIIAISENSSMKEAAQKMRVHRIRHLPVTNSVGRIVGILSDRDIGRLRKVLPINDFEESVRAEDYHLVKYHMNTPVLEAKASDSLESVTKRMLHSKISCFLIVDEYSAPCGIVTTDDVLGYFVEQMEKTKKDDVAVGTLFQYLKVPTYE
jgi:CBS domain-containing protein